MDRMAGLVLWNGGIFLIAAALVAIFRVGSGVQRFAIIGVGYVAGRASAGPVIAGMIVSAGHRKQRIEQARLLQTQEDQISA